MTTKVADVKIPAHPPETARLAAHGGPKAVCLSYRERWRLDWLRLGIRFAKHMRWGITTLGTSEGPVLKFETEFAQLAGCRFGVAMNSGTAALHSALFAVGVGPDDEVILPSYTWHASASAVLCCGAKPVFCDINPRTLTADPVDIAKRVTPRTRAIMVVHTWGNPAELDAIAAVAKEHGLPLVEDCSHAHGASYQGRPVGSWGDVGCFSLQGGKAVSAGEGGIAVCNRREYYDRMLALGHPLRAGLEAKDFGWPIGFAHLGPKYRPHLFGVVLAQASLDRLTQLNELRRRNWAVFCEGLAGCNGVAPVETLPGAERGGFLEYKFILDLNYLGCTLAEFVELAQAEGLFASKDRYGSLHETPAFRMGGPIRLGMLAAPPADLPPLPELPNTNSLRERVLSLPGFTDVPVEFVRQYVAGIRKVAEHLAGRRARGNNDGD